MSAHGEIPNTLAPITLTRTYSVALLLLMLRGWVSPLPSSLWLDETGLYYVIAGSWADFLYRMSLTIQSPLHSTLLWGIFHYVGGAEWVLRAPSVLSMLIAAYLVYKIGASLDGHEMGLIATTIFVALPETCALACQARPYAMGIAAGLWSIWLYLRWREERRLTPALLWALSLILVLYIHPLLAATLGLLFAVLLLLSFARNDGAAVPQLIFSGTLTCVAALPILPYYLAAIRQAGVYSHGRVPTFMDLLERHPLGLLAGALCLSLAAVSLLPGRLAISRFTVNGKATSLLLLWAGVPVSALFLIARTTPAEIFALRYSSLALPAVALLAGLGIRSLDTRRTLLTVLTSALMVLATWGFAPQPQVSRFKDDWRAAARMLHAENYDPETVVFLSPMFTEARDLTRLTHPGYRDFLLSPFKAYPVPGRVIPLPQVPGPQFHQYLQPFLDGVLSRRAPFYVAGLGHWTDWFAWHLEPDWRVSQIHPLIARFDRRPPSPKSGHPR